MIAGHWMGFHRAREWIMAKKDLAAAAAKADEAKGKADAPPSKWLVRAGDMPTGPIMNVCDTQAEAEVEIINHRQMGRGQAKAWFQEFDEAELGPAAGTEVEQGEKKDPPAA